MALVKKVIKHVRQGTVVERVGVGLGHVPEYVRVHWEGAENPAQGVRALTRCAQLFLRGADSEAWVLSLGDKAGFHQALDQELRRRGISFRSHTLEEVLFWDQSKTGGIRGIVCGYADVRRTTQAARALALQPTLCSVPFEYVAGINSERELFARRDEYADTHFVSPSLLDNPTPYELYEESLQKFEQKCGLRDFLDLYQIIKYVEENNIPGDIAEFGSYKGHSGYLIARTLQVLKSARRLYMFDMFEDFPREPYGIDHFWSGTHAVSFAEVQSKLSQFPNVNLIQGDFTQTLAGSGVGPLSMAYIDCDSYRATRYLISALWENHLSPKAALVCEDYGHPALLGNRAAVHEELDGRADCFKFFSQFSGLYITLKL